MRSPLRWLKRRIELLRVSERRRELCEQLSKEFDQELKLVPASTKGGYDEIYYARSSADIIAVVRVNSPYKTISDPIGPKDPGIPLAPLDRIEREWEAYSKLSTEGLSPTPLWRIEDAMACSWLPWDRLSRVLTSTPAQLWPVLELTLPTIAHMHRLGVAHLDLNLGNLLIDANREKVAVIDFEFGPVPWVTLPQQMAFDYLRLLDDCCKPRRGGKHLLANPENLLPLLKELVPTEIAEAPMAFAFEKLQRLASSPSLRSTLEQVFPKLNEE